MMTNSCAGKILVQRNIAPVDGYVHQTKADIGIIYMSKLKNTQEMKYV